MPKVAQYLSGIEQALSIKYNNLVYEMKQRGEDVIVLSLGEAFFDIPLYSFADLPFPDIYHYGHSRGLLELRQKLSAFYSTRYGVPTDPDTEIIVTAGSKLAIHMAFMALLDPGDEVIVPEPAWVSYVEQIKLCHGNPVMVPFDVPVTEYERYVTPRTRAIVVNNPNNPRGSILGRSELTSLHELAERRDLFLVADEAYSDFVLDRDAFISVGALDPEKHHTIICNSMSKNYGMSGWRIGYSIAHPTVTSQMLKINQHLVTCPATVLQHYLIKHFDDVLAVTEPQIRAVVEKRQHILGVLRDLGLSALPGTATFYIFVCIAESGLGSEEFATRLLRRERVAVVPGVGYGTSCDGYVRISIGTESMERTEAGLRAVQRLIRASVAGQAEADSRDAAPPHPAMGTASVR